MATTKLTIKQEKFCDKYLECGNASEAYRFAYDCSKMSTKCIWEKASLLLSDGKVAARVKQLQDAARAKSEITRERILSELDAILGAKITDYIDLTTETVIIHPTKKEEEAGALPRTVEVQRLVFKDFAELSERQIKAIESVKQGRSGIELKLHGKSWTIERICAMLGYNAPEKKELFGKDGQPFTGFSSVLPVIPDIEHIVRHIDNERSRRLSEEQE